MGRFQLVKEILDQLYEDVPQPRDKAIKAELAHLSDTYMKLLKANQMVDYSPAAARFAYIYRYVVMHSDLVSSVIRRSRSLKKLFSAEEVRVTSLGGGPGSELIGIATYLEKAGISPEVTFTLVDREATWSESWIHFKNELKATANIDPIFLHIDALDQKMWQNKSYLHSDLITLVYFVSELYPFKTQAEDFLRHVLANAPSGCLFLYIDNDDSRFTDWFDNMVGDTGLRCLREESKSITLTASEQKAELGEYLDKFDSPRLTAKACYRICRIR